MSVQTITSSSAANETLNGPENWPIHQNLPPELEQKAQQLAGRFILNASTVSTLGAAAQQASSEVSRELLAHVQVKDVGSAGTLLVQLAARCKAVDPSSLSPSWRSTVSQLPVFGSLFTRAQASASSHHNSIEEIDAISKRLTIARQTILHDVASLSKLYDQNLEIFRDLQVWIRVGRIKLTELDTQTLPLLRQEAVGGDPFASQRLADTQSIRERLDRHIHDLELAAMIRLQNAPKIRIVQAGDMLLAEKLQSSVLNTIPLWKDNLSLAITQQRQKEALQLENAVDEATNALLRSSADMLHENSIQIARQANRGVVDIETLKHTQDRILATLSETKQIADEGARERESARIELGRMEEELKQKLRA